MRRLLLVLVDAALRDSLVQTLAIKKLLRALGQVALYLVLFK